MFPRCVWSRHSRASMTLTLKARMADRVDVHVGSLVADRAAAMRRASVFASSQPVGPPAK